jgi:hypothetical protein
MKHCPKCYCEYENWAEYCANCQVALVDGEPTEDQRDFFKVQLSPKKHGAVMKIQLGIIILVGGLLVLTTIIQIKYIFTTGFFSQPAELISIDIILLFILVFTSRVFVIRKEKAGAYSNIMRQQSGSDETQPPGK